ncbi:MAG: hypothetical protein A4E28_01416 [Methanocella sp. PtaU1.Bin125]|nr:MAG: hypothetical protein A4E28_01416 [Methanocella sp. PtaU1.Bin125]
MRSSIGGMGIGDGDGAGVLTTDVLPVMLLPPPITCSPGGPVDPPGLKADMYPEAKSATSTAAINMTAAKAASLTISLTTLIPYISRTAGK